MTIDEKESGKNINVKYHKTKLKNLFEIPCVQLHIGVKPTKNPLNNSTQNNVAFETEILF